MTWSIAADIVALLGLCLSLWVAYYVYFRGPRLDMLVGRNIFAYPAPLQTASGIIWGGTAFNVPITFVNSGPRPGAIHQLRLTINRSDNLTKVYDLAWNEFTVMLEDERRWGSAGVAQPISIPGHGAVSKTVQFVWLPSSLEKLELIAGRYTIKILGWSTTDSKSSLIHSEEFVLTEQHVKEFRLSETSETALTVSIPLGEEGRQNGIMTMAQIRKLYEN